MKKSLKTIDSKVFQSIIFFVLMCSVVTITGRITNVSLIERLIIGIILGLQIIAFLNVFIKISLLKSYFPNISELKLIKKDISEDLSVDILAVTDEDQCNPDFINVVESTNSYLENNKGSAANFSIIKGITERHLDSVINSISNTISVPLFLGLAGTFFGIITGLLAINFTKSETGISLLDTSGVESLISGVITAMIASVFGLILTLINSALTYKNALSKSEKGKNQYYDFIQTFLLPKLSKDVSDSLGTLRDNLDQFNGKFGENLINYKDSFLLLNDNLTKEKDFLDAIQNVGLVKLSKTIVETFEKVNMASNEFEDFQKYQESLNACVSSSVSVLKEYNTISDTFTNFNKNLELVTGHIVESSDFYHLFKNFLEERYEGVKKREDVFDASISKMDEVLTDKLKNLSDNILNQNDFYNEQWRKTVDVLNTDIVEVFSKLTNYIEEESISLKKYISSEEKSLQEAFTNNKKFFSNFAYVEQFFDKFNAYTEENRIHNDNLQNSINNLCELLSDDKSVLETNKSITELRLSFEGISEKLIPMFLNSKELIEKNNENTLNLANTINNSINTLNTNISKLNTKIDLVFKEDYTKWKK